MIRLEGIRLDAGEAGETSTSGGRLRLLDDIHLQIRTNEYVCLVGPNGAGKSLLLQVLAGLRRPSAGTITFDLPNASFPSRPAIGIVFQTPDDQIVGSTVERDLAFGLESRAVPPAEIRSCVDEALGSAGLTALAQRPPHQLSEGEKQRVALLAALLPRPEILLLDEPTSRLDPPGRRVFLGAVHDAQRETGATVLHVTHRSEEFMLADRIVGLAAGRVVFDGAPAALLHDPGAGRLGALWSGLHRLRRALQARGVPVSDPPPGAWNDVDPLVASLPSS